MSSPAPPRLTELARLAGCAAKAGPAVVEAAIRQVTAQMDDGKVPEGLSLRLLVGLAPPDDAAVYKITDDQAIVATVDFFAPIVDDPYCYGAIAAANAMSDVYAMGGEVVLALNIAAFPVEMDEQTITEILRGGAEKVTEAGAGIVGGHTIIDEEPKYGLAAIGLVHPDRVFTKAGARPGDAIYVTKLIGTGLVTTAAKFDEANPDHLASAVAWMAQLNRGSARIVREGGATSLTDVTGFGLLGHGHEIAAASGVGLRLESSKVPLLTGALDYAYRGILNGGGMRNRQHFSSRVQFDHAIAEELQHTLFDPQTSGGCCSPSIRRGPSNSKTASRQPSCRCGRSAP